MVLRDFCLTHKFYYMLIDSAQKHIRQKKNWNSLNNLSCTHLFGHIH